MNNVAYPAWIRELHESEVFGEALALALIDVAKNQRDHYHFCTLLQLETETKARLRPLLFNYGVPLSENIELDGIEAIVGAYKAMNDLQAFAAAIKPTVEDFLSRFEEIARGCPDENREVAESMVRHESAILKWLAMESEGESEGSLDDMIRELRYPLAIPSSSNEGVTR